MNCTRLVSSSLGYSAAIDHAVSANFTAMAEVHILSIDFDKVIQSTYVTAKADYQFALDRLVPIMNKLDIQRKIQSPRFYRRLEKDLAKGCIMPPLTLAILSDTHFRISDKKAILSLLHQQENVFILDGIQRLNTLQRVFKSDVDINPNNPIFLNIIVCQSMDKLLYRMITLNNGQKPMTARHQIEVLAANLYDFESVELPVQSEKKKGHKKKIGAFKKAEMIKSYMAFLSSSVNIDNQKIIQEKMDELLVDKIINSDISESNVEFDNVLDLMGEMLKNSYLTKWLRVENNLIGFAAGVRKSFAYLNTIEVDSIEEGCRLFEEAFSGFDVSKIKLGRERRKSVKFFIENFEAMATKDPLDVMEAISNID